MKVYRCGIVGLRGIGAQRPDSAPHPSLIGLQPYSHAAAYAVLPNTKVVAVCDLQPQLLQDFSRDWCDTWQDVQTYTDYREMLERGNLDILSVCTSDHRHAQIVVDACAAGVKAIFCEKPIATSLADADRMIEAVNRHDVVMSINHTRRWLPDNLQARELIRSGAIGSLQRIMRTGGGPRAMLFRNGTHSIDQICFLVESDPAVVFAELDPEFDDYGPRYAGDGGRDPSTDPGGSAYIRFQNGVRAFYNFSKGTVNYGETMLFGDKGWIRLSNWGNEAPVEIAVMDSEGIPRRSFLPVEQYARTGAVAAIAEIIEVLERGSGETLSSAHEARKTLEIILAMLHSHALDGELVRLPIDEERPQREGAAS